MLSRESDMILQAEAAASEGAILVSFWRQPGMAADSGTPTTWLLELPGVVVNVHCVCPPEIAAERCQRSRHPRHLDAARSREDTLASLRAIARLEPIEAGQRVDIDTTREVCLDAVMLDLNGAFLNCTRGGWRSSTASPD
jgi:glucokinase